MKIKTKEMERMDEEANEFAFNLLMPDADFRFFVENVSGDVDRIALHFGVSPLMVRIKASRMGFKGGYEKKTIQTKILI